jgi:hypothetical protein
MARDGVVIPVTASPASDGSSKQDYTYSPAAAFALNLRRLQVGKPTGDFSPRPTANTSGRKWVGFI